MINIFRFSALDQSDLTLPDIAISRKTPMKKTLKPLDYKDHRRSDMTPSSKTIHKISLPNEIEHEKFLKLKLAHDVMKLNSSFASGTSNMVSF